MSLFIFFKTAPGVGLWLIIKAHSLILHVHYGLHPKKPTRKLGSGFSLKRNWQLHNKISGHYSENFIRPKTPANIYLGENNNDKKIFE